MQQEQNNRTNNRTLPTLKFTNTDLNTDSVVSSPLKHVLRTRIRDLIEFTLCEKQKYQVTICN